MNKVFLSGRMEKAAVDILLVVGLLLSMLSSHYPNSAWCGSFHCITSLTWYLLILVHIEQHWKMVKSLSKRKVWKRNVITALAVVAFCLMTVSIILFAGGTGHRIIHIHHVIANLFWLVCVIHTLTKLKRFALLFKKVQKNRSV
jgi:ABC-type microcin C transport system permease subunit YejB